MSKDLRGIYKKHQDPPGFRVFSLVIPGWRWVDLFILRKRSRDLWFGMYVWCAGSRFAGYYIFDDSG